MSSNTTVGIGMEKDRDSLWYFTAEQLANSPSRRHGIDSDQELSYRQMTAYLIQEMGQRLQVSQLCINTAIVYMHRFYAFHSFTHFHRNGIAAASLFLAAKVEEQPRKLEHVIKAANKCLNQPTSSTTDTYYLEQAQDLVFNENVLLQTLGFDVAIDHPHTHVVKTCQLVKACKDLAQTSYFLASNSLHLTSMCLQYKPTVVACFCIYLACKWSRWEIPQSTEGKHWFYYVDKSVTMELLKQLTDEFIQIYEKSPARLKSKLNTIRAIAQGAGTRSVKDKKSSSDDFKMQEMMKMYHSADSGGMAGGQYAHNPVDPQNVPPPLLPPPQPMRKMDSHSAQIRGHPNTPAHPNKVYPSSGDMLQQDLKGNHNKSFNGTMAPRSSREHPQSHQQMVSNLQRGNMHSSSSSSRASSSNLPIQGQQRSSLPSHHGDVSSVKFNRERGNNTINLQNPSAIPKIPKMDISSRSNLKDPLSKLPENNKQQGLKQLHQNSSNMSTQQFPGNQFPSSSCPQAATKPDTVADMVRNNGQNQRSYIGSNGRSNVLPPNYKHQQHAMFNVKPDQQKSSSTSFQAHRQQQLQQQQQQHLQQQLQANQMDALFLSNSDLLMDSQHHSSSHGLTSDFISMRPPENILAADDHSSGYSTSFQQQQQQQHQQPPLPQQQQQQQSHQQHQQQHQQQQQQQQKESLSSLFSPEWPMLGTNVPSDSMIAKMQGESFPFKPSANIKESPKKSEIERSFVEPPPTTTTSSSSSTQKKDNAATINKNYTHQQQKLFSSHKKQQESAAASVDNEHASTSAGLLSSSSLKRPIEPLVKLEDSSMPSTKIRKLENTSVPVGVQQALQLEKAMAADVKPQVVNGIETNPDLVKSLLKESLCVPSFNLLNETNQQQQQQQPPGGPSGHIEANLVPNLNTNVINPSSSTTININLNTNTASTSVPTDPSLTDSSSIKHESGRSEKKKKKEKHKHKDKDKDKDKSKDKDKEERKKHKKDKDKHKDRERDREPGEIEHVKIKITKEKLESSGSGSTEPAPIFKIKIPKDRITGEINLNNNGNSAQLNTSGPVAHATILSSTHTHTPALKIKISKDKLENYTSGSAIQTNYPDQNSHNTNPSYGTYTSSHHHKSSSHSSSKKKDRDRDRERDKEKKRSSHDHQRSHSSSSSASTSKSQHQSK